MKKLSYLFFLLSMVVFYSCSNEDDIANPDDDDDTTYILSLPDYQTHTLDLGDREHPVYSWVLSSDYGTTHYIQTVLTDKNKLFDFDCFSSTEYGFGSNSFAFTNCNADNCPDFANYDYRAVTKKGVNNNKYVIVGADGFATGENYDKVPSIRFKNHENTAKLEDYIVKGLFVTNSVFAYNSMKDGSTIFSGTDKFDKNDSFKLTIYNFDKTKNVEVLLAKGTDILNTWKWVDLTSLGETSGLKFTMTTTKVNNYGAMTPTYFCLDGITLIED